MSTAQSTAAEYADLEPRPGEHLAYLYFEVFEGDPDAQRHITDPDFPVGFRFTEDEDESCK